MENNFDWLADRETLEKKLSMAKDKIKKFKNEKKGANKDIDAAREGINDSFDGIIGTHETERDIYQMFLTSGNKVKKFFRNTLLLASAGVIAVTTYYHHDTISDIVSSTKEVGIYKPVQETNRAVVPPKTVQKSNRAVVVPPKQVQKSKQAVAYVPPATRRTIVHKTQTKEYKYSPPSQQSFYSSNEFWYFPIREDTLSKISIDVTGSMDNWRQIKRYNNLTSETIEVNQPLRIPPSLVRNTKNLYKGFLNSKIYIVSNKRSWNILAKKMYGDRDLFQKVYNYNKKFNPRLSTKLWSKQYMLAPQS